jgi:hypothetical protein
MKKCELIYLTGRPLFPNFWDDPVLVPRVLSGGNAA